MASIKGTKGSTKSTKYHNVHARRVLRVPHGQAEDVVSFVLLKRQPKSTKYHSLKD